MSKTNTKKNASYSNSSELTMFDKFELWAEKNNKKLFYIDMKNNPLQWNLCFR